MGFLAHLHGTNGNFCDEPMISFDDPCLCSVSFHSSQFTLTNIGTPFFILNSAYDVYQVNTTCAAQLLSFLNNLLV